MNIQDKDFTEEEIDDIVTTQADEVAAWEQPVNVRKIEYEGISIPAATQQNKLKKGDKQC
ncbi:MAG: hypothetical protein M3371_02440 [Acidobacteriota bacterium]|nr:hypothetical protein [Acidobacteriota bacterium]